MDLYSEVALTRDLHAIRWFRVTHGGRFTRIGEARRAERRPTAQGQETRPEWCAKTPCGSVGGGLTATLAGDQNGMRSNRRVECCLHGRHTGRTQGAWRRQLRQPTMAWSLTSGKYVSTTTRTEASCR